MLLFTLPIAIIIGVLIGRNYTPQSKGRKILAAFLIPTISGIIINTLVASCSVSGFGFWEDYGRYFVFVAIPAFVLFITLLITLKVDEKTTRVRDTINNVATLWYR